MRGTAGKMNFVVARGAKRIIARLQPFEPCERKPPRRLQQIVHMLRAPRRQFMFPVRILSKQRRNEKHAHNAKQTQFSSDTICVHERNYIVVPSAVKQRAELRVPKETRTPALWQTAGTLIFRREK